MFYWRSVPSYNANIYYESAQIISQNNTRIGKYTPVIITTLCFSIEMYLKSLNSVLVLDFIKHNGEGFKPIEEYSKVNYKGHTFSQLYVALNDETKTVLENEYIKSKLAIEYKSINEILSIFSDMYITYRYIFEQTTNTNALNLSNLKHLSDFFFETINKWSDLS